MASKNDNLLMLGLVFISVFFIIASAFAFYFYMDSVRQADRYEKEYIARAEDTKAKQKLQESWDKLKAMIGSNYDGNRANFSKIQKEVTEFIEKIYIDATITDDNRAENLKALSERLLREIRNIQSDVEIANKRELDIKAAFETFKKQNEKIPLEYIENRAAALKKFEEMLDSGAKRRDELNKQLDEEKQQNQKKITQFEEENKRILDDKEKEAQKSLDFEKENNSLRRKITELEKRITDLTNPGKRPAPTAGGGARFIPMSKTVDDGKIVETWPERDRVMIDRGQKQRITRGLRFQVYTNLGDNRKILKGEIEVLEVNSDWSLCRIVNHNLICNTCGKDFPSPTYTPGQLLKCAICSNMTEVTPRPIRKGDIIDNADYDPEKPLMVYHLGPFSGSLKKEYFLRLLENRGNNFAETFNNKVDLLVLPVKMTDELQKELDKARVDNDRVQVVSEEEFIKLMTN